MGHLQPVRVGSPHHHVKTRMGGHTAPFPTGGGTLDRAHPTSRDDPPSPPPEHARPLTACRERGNNAGGTPPCQTPGVILACGGVSMLPPRAGRLPGGSGSSQSEGL